MISKKRQSETLRNTIMFPRCFPCDPISCPAVTSALMSPAIGMSMIHLLSDSPTIPVFRPLSVSVCVCPPICVPERDHDPPPSPGHRIPLSLAAPAPGSHEASGFSHPGSHFPGCKSSPLSSHLCPRPAVHDLFDNWEHLHWVTSSDTGTLLLLSELSNNY